jgi:hypothetical protein
MKQDRPLDGVLLITQPSHQIIRPMKINSASPKASTCSTDKALIRSADAYQAGLAPNPNYPEMFPAVQRQAWMPADSVG